MVHIYRQLTFVQLEVKIVHNVVGFIRISDEENIVLDSEGAGVGHLLRFVFEPENFALIPDDQLGLLRHRVVVSYIRTGHYNHHLYRRRVNG